MTLREKAVEAMSEAFSAEDVDATPAEYAETMLSALLDLLDAEWTPGAAVAARVEGRAMTDQRLPLSADGLDRLTNLMESYYVDHAHVQPSYTDMKRLIAQARTALLVPELVDAGDALCKAVTGVDGTPTDIRRGIKRWREARALLDRLETNHG